MPPPPAAAAPEPSAASVASPRRSRRSSRQSSAVSTTSADNDDDNDATLVGSSSASAAAGAALGTTTRESKSSRRPSRKAREAKGDDASNADSDAAETTDYVSDDVSAPLRRARTKPRVRPSASAKRHGAIDEGGGDADAAGLDDDDAQKTRGQGVRGAGQAAPAPPRTSPPPPPPPTTLSPPSLSKHGSSESASVSAAERAAARLARRAAAARRLRAVVGRFFGVLPPLLLLAAAVLSLLLPVPQKPYARDTYVDENALQPTSIQPEWDYRQVSWADELAKDVAALGEMSSESRAAYVVQELASRGLKASTQAYSFRLPPSSLAYRRAYNASASRGAFSELVGVNVYARWPSARSDGKEAVVISASWRSVWDGQQDPDMPTEVDGASAPSCVEGVEDDYAKAGRRRVNVRGVSLALTLARYLTGHRNWSKDLIFVISDDHLAGMQAWLKGYYGERQSNLDAEPVDCGGALLWNAISIDYPSDSFSELVILPEGLNGQLPNMDAFNSVAQVARSQAVRPRLWGSDEDDGYAGGASELGQLGEELDRRYWGIGGSQRYLRGARNILSQIARQAGGRPSGPHGLFHRYHIDAVTAFAVPAKGPNGFFHLGRIVESTLRSFSNLIERLHHSQFFYLLTSTKKFVQIATFVGVALLPSAALTITGIAALADEGFRAASRKGALVEAMSGVQGPSNGHALPSAAEGLNPYASAGLSSSLLHVPLEKPTDHELLRSVLSLSVSRAIRDGRLLTPRSISSTISATRSLGRPLTVAFTGVLLVQAACLGAFAIATRTPVDCASRGLEHCRQLRSVAAIFVAAVLAGGVCLAIACSSRLQTQRFGGAAQKLVSDMASRRRAAARLLHAITLLQAGMALVVASLLNFPLAAVVTVLCAVPLYASRPTASAEGRQAVAGGSVGAVRRLAHLLWATVLLALTPPVLLAVVAAYSRAAASGSLPTLSSLHPAISAIVSQGLWRDVPVPVRADGDATCPGVDLGLGSLSRAERALDAALWDHHVLGSATLALALLAYTPLPLQAALANLLAALA